MNIPKKIVNKIMKIYSLQEEVDKWFTDSEQGVWIEWGKIEITNKSDGDSTGGNTYTCFNHYSHGDIFYGDICIDISKGDLNCKFLKLDACANAYGMGKNF